MVKRFKKKPVVIEAIQWTGENFQEVSEFGAPLVSLVTKKDGSKVLFCQTLEGPLKAKVNDWIIRGIENEIYPCRVDIFEKTYEEV